MPFRKKKLKIKEYFIALYYQWVMVLMFSVGKEAWGELSMAMGNFLQNVFKIFPKLVNIYRAPLRCTGCPRFVDPAAWL
jgi:hypothetical protein